MTEIRKEERKEKNETKKSNWNFWRWEIGYSAWGWGWGGLMENVTFEKNLSYSSYMWEKDHFRQRKTASSNA